MAKKEMAKKDTDHTPVTYNGPGKDHFLRYVRGFENLEEWSKEAIKDMIHGWEDFKKAVGKKKALKVYWEWANRTPYAKYGMCDPDGN